jgi:hypothetical protein
MKKVFTSLERERERDKERERGREREKGLLQKSVC